MQLTWSPPLLRPDLTNVVAIDANARYWVALRADGTVVRGGQLADDSLTPTLERIVAIRAGGGHTLALREDGQLSTSVAEGNVFQDQILPLPKGLGAVAKMAAGYAHSVVLDLQGQVWAWGANTHGPFDPPSWATNVLEVAAGQLYSAAILADGSVRAWSDYSWPPIGNPPPGHQPAIQVDVSAFGHALSLRADGRVFAWGNNSHGQATVPLTARAEVVQVAAGGLHSVALKRDGTAVAWGDGQRGQLNIPAGMKFLAIAASAYSTYGLTRTPAIGEVTVPDQAGAGDDVAIEVAVGARDPYRTYLYSDEHLVATADVPRLVLTNVQPGLGPRFRLVVSNEFGWTANDWVYLSIYDRPPRITRQPRDQAVSPGADARFEADARGSEPLEWQWQLNGVDIPGATAPILELPAATMNASGEYRVVVRNTLGTATSEAAFLSVGLPVIAEQPLSLYQRQGFPTLLWARVVSASPVKFQWWRADAPIQGETEAALALGPAGPAITGAYRLTLSNAFGAVTSRTARVRLYDPPAIVSRPALPVIVGDWMPSEVAVPAGLTNAVAVGIGDTHGLALRADGQLVGWGTPSNGGEWNPAEIPSGMGAVAALAIGRSHNTTLRQDGTVRSWGATYDQPTDLGDAIAVSAGAYGFNLALKRNGTVVQWPEPASVPDGLTNVIAIARGTGSSMVLQADGTVLDWIDPGAPARRRFQDPQAIAIATSEYGRWCLLESGEVLGWNNGDAPPQKIPGVTNAVALACVTTWGGAYCLLADGQVFSQEWGLLPGLAGVEAIAGAQRSVVALSHAPFADVPPAGTNLPSGGRLVLSVQARSSTPLSYQWEHAGVEIPGARGPGLVIESISAFDLGDYRVRLINANHTLTTPAARVWVLGPVEFREWPDQELAAGSDLLATPDWAGEGPVSFQWELDGTALATQTNATLAILNVQAADAGWYRLRATNPYGPSVSQGFRLRVQPSPPRLTLLPADATVRASSDVTFHAEARGTEPFTWQWYFEQGALPAATNRVLALRNVQSAQAGAYTVEVRSSMGPVRSPAGVLTVLPSAPVALGGPALRLALEGNRATMEQPFLGSEPITWQWRRAGVDLPGATARTLELAAATLGDVADYTVVAHNALGAAESPPVHLAVIPTAGEGTVVGWGNLTVPTGLSGVVSLDGGLSFAVALKRDGTVVRFGREVSPELTPPAGLDRVVRVATGTGHACALREDQRREARRLRSTRPRAAR